MQGWRTPLLVKSAEKSSLDQMGRANVDGQLQVVVVAVQAWKQILRKMLDVVHLGQASHWLKYIEKSNFWWTKIYVLLPPL
jgi:hypothetical protein